MTSDLIDLRDDRSADSEVGVVGAVSSHDSNEGAVTEPAELPVTETESEPLTVEVDVLGRGEANEGSTAGISVGERKEISTSGSPEDTRCKPL
jgi:hypothetical protein